MSGDADDYRTIPALAAYIDRIHAEQLNFRRFMVKEYRGNYYTERSIIRIQADGTIEADDEQYAPTEDEAERIRAALREVKWPKAIGAESQTLIELRKKSGASQNNLFVFWDLARTKIAMVQERKQFDDGSKAYIPWTFFDDGVWRRMEPDTALPFWKPPLGSKRDRIMVHEGAKAASYIDTLLNDAAKNEERKAHPWAEELYLYEHWGMIGGALAPHRADYSELRKSQPVEVVYVCDNDHAGKAVLQEFSRHYGGKLKGIKFSPSWPESWDMGDEIPKSMFKKGRYNGPDIRSLIEPATYATEQVPNPRGGRPVFALRRAFREEWSHSVRPEVFIHCDWPNRIWIPSEFNNLVRPFSAVDDTARLMRCDAVSKSCVIKYDPSHKPGIYEDAADGRYINTHCPPAIRAEAGDVSPWLEFMEQLIPDEGDRNEMMKWCATLIARPDIKMTYGVLLISEIQGVGKTTLGEKILAPLVGLDNVSFPNEHDICESGFNYWCAHKRLAIINEIYSGHSSKAYNRLKSIITDKVVTVSKKFQANYDIQNWVHVLACSNSPRALRLSDDDRRWFVPKITETRKAHQFWSMINDWLVEDGGLAKIKGWAIDYCKNNAPVQGGAIAPWSQLKKELIEENMSPGQQLVAQALDHVRENMNGSPVVLLDCDLVDLIRSRLYEGRHNDRLEKPMTVRKVAKSRGWYISPGRATVKAWGTLTRAARMICSDKETANTSPTKLAEDGVLPLKAEDILPY